VKTAYLALGSNLGDRFKNLVSAVHLLADGGDLTVTKASSVYETEPVGVIDQPDFLNLVLAVQTDLSPEKLLVFCLEVEASLGRVRRERWGPRNIDVDVLWYDDQRIDSANLSVPHPRMLERAFVLIPLAEIVPELVIEGETIAARAASVGETRIKQRDEKIVLPKKAEHPV
jgi:2-amino-4-hydroxy-6-hydroxymethyldihydropteridine diphosphokinase